MRHSLRLTLCGALLLCDVALAQQPPPKPTFQSAATLTYDRTRMEEAANKITGVLISNGYDFDPFAATRAANSDPLLNMGTQFNDADLVGRLAELTRQANRVNATVYAFDPRGLVAGQDIDEPVDQVEWATHTRKTQDSLRVIADLTGGFAVVNTNDFATAMKKIDSETSDYYVLGYYSSNPDPLQRRRVIEIKLAKKDAANNFDLDYRKEYTLKPAARR